MASFFIDENDLSAVMNRTQDELEDSSFGSELIKQPVFAPSPPQSGDMLSSTTVDNLSTSTPEAAHLETEADRIRRMNDESERLAWELMQQESIDAYNYQLEFMRENSAALDPADLAALEQAMAEERRSIAVADAHDDVDIDEEPSEEWSYEQLLALGQAVGDVKTERWKIRARAVIQCLPVYTFGTEELSTSSKHAAHDANCVVCMELYSTSDAVRLLPCHHFFHTECADKWLEDHNTCPSCKKKITSSP